MGRGLSSHPQKGRSLRPNRISLPVLAIAALAALALVACGSEAGGVSEADGDAAWSFTDGSGKTVELDARPQRIIAHATAAASLLSFGIRPVGIYADTPIEDDPGLERFDLEGIEILGETWGEIDVAKAAELQPDLIVADYWPPEDAYSGFEEGVKEKSKKLAELAPVVGAAQGESVVKLIETYERLAESLGADTDSPEIAAEKERFEKAVENFEKVTAEKRVITALAVSPTPDLLYVAVPEHAPELLDFTRWGLEVIVPDDPDQKLPYWENLSWENADKYQPDLLLIDDRNYPDNLRDAEKQPTWESIRAAKEGAIVPWPGYWLHTYADLAEQLERMAKEIEKLDPSLGDE